MTTLSAIPMLIEDDFPFVLHGELDKRPFLARRGARLRRGPDRVWVEVELNGMSVNSIILDADGGAYLTAWLGPVLDEHWRRYADEGVGCLTPRERLHAPTLLTALMSRRVATPNVEGHHVDVVPPGGDVNGTSVVVGVAGDLERELDALIALSSLPAAIALTIFTEHLHVQRLRLGLARTPEGRSFDEWLDRFGDVAELLNAVLADVNSALKR